MSAIRQILISTIAFAVIPPVCLRGSDIAEYVGGTVKTIPVNVSGSLSTADSKELQFNYGQSVYRLPYAQITSTDAAAGEGRHILHKIPVPSFGKRKETLAINYKDAAGANGTLNFELSAHQAKATREAIALWKAAPASAAAAVPDSTEWWGDRYWTTNRNKASWPGAASAGTPTVTPGTPATSGTKE